MQKTLLCAWAIVVLPVAMCIAQMSPEDAAERLREREAAASTQPDPEELTALKAAVADLRAKNEQLQEQNNSIQRLVRQTPRAGKNFAIIRGCPFARVIETPLVFDATPEGYLHQGVQGKRSQVTSQAGGLALTVNGTRSSQTFQSVTQQHAWLAQFALYHVFINNGTPFNPQVDPEANVRAQNDAYVVLVNVDDGYVAFAGESDLPWRSPDGTGNGNEADSILNQTSGIRFGQ